jgi:hypothetical protein
MVEIEMQRLVEGLGNEEEGESGFEVYVGKGREGAEDRSDLGADTPIDFASVPEVYTAARAGFSGACGNRRLAEPRKFS